MKQDSSMEATMARIKLMEQGISLGDETGYDMVHNMILKHTLDQVETLDKLKANKNTTQEQIFNAMKNEQPYEVKANPETPKPPMVINIKRTNPKAVLPTYGHIGEDACFDLTAIDATVDEYGNSVYDFGWAFEIPQGYVGLIFPRSSICKKDMMLGNAVGIIDSGFRSNVTAKFRPLEKNPSSAFSHTNIYQVGERVCQMMIVPVPQVEFHVVDELSTTSRGEGGYGSTGK